MRVLVAMSGGVDSSVAAALVLEAGHEAVGATMKLWGGSSDRGCCSVADVDDAQRVAQQLGISHHVFNFSEDFDRHVVDPYVAAHADGLTPNPCVECNRHLKFDRFLDRAVQLGFDAVATGHHARVATGPDGGSALLRGADQAKDQSYVLHMLGQKQLKRVILPVGAMTKADVRARAAELQLRTAAKADSQDVCFISRAGGREEFLRARIPLHPAEVVDAEGRRVGTLPAVELVTVGQRRGLAGSAHPPGERRYVVDVDVPTATVRVGSLDDLLVSEVPVGPMSWVAGPPYPDEGLEVQMSAHGQPEPARWSPAGRVLVGRPVRRVAAGQSVVLYRGDAVVGGGPALVA
ncbi:MAG: tRNA 2-thiouridine(34) synthase MnmA [Acidimicrobiales bacterium]|nr:tRNA 2-thiouridine(34) synthase MnmA [Acidimicrobiales bacterium]